MKDNYTDYVNSQLSKKQITIQGNKDHEYLYSGWEINRITDNINNIYYKNEIINTVRNLLKTGISPKDIFIFNKSFSVEKKYYHIRTGKIKISAPSIKQLYYLGLPFSLKPNKQTILMNLFFQGYKEVYTICNDNSVNIPKTGDTLQKLYRDSKSNKINSLIDHILFIIKECNQLTPTTKMESVNKKIKNKLANLDKDYKYINALDLKDSDFLKNENIKKYDSFEYFFNKLDRPVVAVKEGNTVRIICYDFIVKSKYNSSNPRFLETNKVSQNSPLFFLLSLSVTFLPSLVLVIKKRKQLKTTQLQNLEESEIASEAIEEEKRLLREEIQELISTEHKIDHQLIQQDFNQFKNEEDHTSSTDETDFYIAKLENTRELETQKTAEFMEKENLTLIEVQDKDSSTNNIISDIPLEFLDTIIKSLAENFTPDLIAETLKIPIEVVNNSLKV